MLPRLLLALDFPANALGYGSPRAAADGLRELSYRWARSALCASVR